MPILLWQNKQWPMSQWSKTSQNESHKMSSWIVSTFVKCKFYELILNSSFPTIMSSPKGTMIPCLHLKHFSDEIQYIPRNMHTVFALLYVVVVIHWLIFPHPSGLLHWHCGNLTIAPVPAKQPWWIWINISCEFIMNDCITTTKQSTTKPCSYFLGYTVAFKKTYACCIILLESLCIHFYISFLTILAQSRFTGCHDFMFYFISQMTSLLEEISFGSNHRI